MVARQMMGLRKPYVFLGKSAAVFATRAMIYTDLHIYIELHKPGGWRTTIRQNSPHDNRNTT